MRSIKLMVALVALLSLSGCATMYGGYPPPVIICDNVNQYAPVLHYQNQAGGWEPIYDGGRIELPINQGDMTFRITPNGHFVGYDATLDGVLIGTGANLHFGFGTGTHDGGKHLLVVNVQRKFSPQLGDPVSEEIVDSHTFRVIVFYRATW